MKLSIILLLFSLTVSCKKPGCDVFADIDSSIEDCYAIATCSNGALDKDTLNLCLAEKEKKAQENE